MSTEYLDKIHIVLENCDSMEFEARELTSLHFDDFRKHADAWNLWYLNYDKKENKGRNALFDETVCFNKVRIGIKKRAGDVKHVEFGEKKRPDFCKHTKWERLSKMPDITSVVVTTKRRLFHKYFRMRWFEKLFHKSFTIDFGWLRKKYRYYVDYDSAAEITGSHWDDLNLAQVCEYKAPDRDCNNIDEEYEQGEYLITISREYAAESKKKWEKEWKAKHTQKETKTSKASKKSPSTTKKASTNGTASTTTSIQKAHSTRKTTQRKRSKTTSTTTKS